LKTFYLQYNASSLVPGTEAIHAGVGRVWERDQTSSNVLITESSKSLWKFEVEVACENQM